MVATWQNVSNIKNMTEWYLFGDKSNPDLLSKDIFRNEDSYSVQISDYEGFITDNQSPLRFANLSQIAIVNKFFENFVSDPYPDNSGTNPYYLAPGEYTIQQIQEHYGEDINSYALKQFEYEPL